MIVITVARKPLAEATVAGNALAFGTGGINIDASRIGSGTGGDAPIYIPNLKNAVFGFGLGGGVWDSTKGRWPANVLLEHSTRCTPSESVDDWVCVAECPVKGGWDGHFFKQIGESK